MKNLIKCVNMISEPKNHHILIYRQNVGVEIYTISAERMEKILALFTSSPLGVDISFHNNGRVSIVYRDSTRYEWYIKEQEKKAAQAN